MENKEGIYRFYWYCGRMGFLEGLFIATMLDVEYVIGKNVIFGEVLGKHSDIKGIVERDEIKLISDNPEDVAWFKKLNLSMGYNPIQKLKDYENDI